MFITSKSLIFLLFITVVINGRPTLNNLSSDPSNTAAKQVSDDVVELIGPGAPVELILLDGFLDVKIDLFNCLGLVKFCYSSLDENREAASLCRDNFCGFNVFGKFDEIELVRGKHILKSHLQQNCDAIRMNSIQTPYCGIYDASCKPFMDNENKITIIVESISCPTFIQRAKIYVPPTPSSSLSPSEPSSPDVADASTKWYIWIIMVGVILLFIGGIILGIVFCWKKQLCCFEQKKEIKKKITISETVNSTLITKDENILEANLPKSPPKPTQKTAEEIPPSPKAATKDTKKVEKKAKKVEEEKKEKKIPKKETVDDVPSSAPETQSAPPAPVFSNIPPRPIITQEQILEEDYSFRKPPKEWSKRIKNTSNSHSSKNSYGQVERNTPKMQMEPHYSCMRRQGLIMTQKYRELKKNYKVDAAKKPLDVEISLLTDCIGDIFVTINRLIEQSHAVLKERGAEFDENGKSKKYPPSVFEYLSDPETPEYMRFVAMAAEIEEIIPVDDIHLKQYSISLLLFIGFTKSFPDAKRRHALAIFRRKLPKIRAKSSVEERETFGYPANAIETAFKRDSRCFDDLKFIKTDSTVNLSEVTQE
uniref:Uncharacterized protein n=1 Tax=Panagrolaimus superbus TaxID=310955 RepID=A0A914YJ86_9BILA